MSLDNYLALFLDVVTFAGVVLVIPQLRAGLKQRRSEALVEIFDINRKLLSLGFDHSSLFAILEDKQHDNPAWERRYLHSSIRLGLNYVQGLHRDKAERIVAERNQKAFVNLPDLLDRVPLNKAERRVLAKIGALNQLSDHRRTALWDVDALYDKEDLLLNEKSNADMPLLPMNPVERLQADYDGTRVTTGPHPMSFVRHLLPHVTQAVDLYQGKHGQSVTIAGVVICRQRPGTAKGHVFISLEDETGIANAFVRSELFEKLRLVITHEPFLEIKGTLQHLEGVVSVLTKSIRPLNSPAADLTTQSYDFH